MIPLPLSLCVFDSAKGHFNRTDIYKRCINDLAAKLPLDTFRHRVVHIKVSGPQEESTFIEQEAFYRNLGFLVIRSDGAWSHFSLSHQQEYCRDLVKVYEFEPVATTDYVLHLESDWLFDLRGDYDLIDYLSKGMSYLRHDATLVGVRFPRFTNEVERLNGLRAKHGLDVRAEPATDPWELFIRHNDHSMNPTIWRSRDMYLATRLLKQHFGQFGHHVEHGFVHCLKWMSDGELPFAIFDPKEVGALHIGTKAGEEDPAGGIVAN